MTHTAVLLLGSNLPHREKQLDAAVARMAAVTVITGRSSIYVSPDRSGLGKPYANMVIQCDTQLDISELRKYISDTERCLGRTPQSKTIGMMPIDIDLVLWDGKVISRSDYDSPHYLQCMSTMSLHMEQPIRLNNN
ncbi:MAG: 2-amino-4-hydroxy-6-hydroxymethyldihydropteridine diphosphokinase [Muribaculaceae bacterium]|nr:2-amino-4-hydroxy-6-hydroxymethyldihydropteridine diphosphokinase [Muribaculaceae bacterium]